MLPGRMRRGRMSPAILLQPAQRLLQILSTHLGGTDRPSMDSPAPRWWQFSNLHPETEHIRENSNHAGAQRSPNAFSIPLRSQEPKPYARTELLKTRSPRHAVMGVQERHICARRSCCIKESWEGCGESSLPAPIPNSPDPWVCCQWETTQPTESRGMPGQSFLLSLSTDL